MKPSVSAPRWGLLVLACLLALGAAPAVDLTQWGRMATLDVPPTPAPGLLEVSLSPEALAAARPDLADLRLLSPANVIVPYVLRLDRGEARRAATYRPERLFNPVFVPHQQSSITLDFGSRAARSRIDVDTPGTNFRRRATVEASADGASWQVLCKTAWLFRIAYDTGSYNKNQITLPDNDFRYLRLTVFNAPDDPEEVLISSVVAWYDKSTPPQALEVPTRTVTVTENPPLKATDIEVDLAYENLPLDNVSLTFTDATFLRRVEVFARNAKTHTFLEPVENAQPRRREVEVPWENLTQGTVYRLPGGNGQDLSTGQNLPLHGQYRYLLLRIYNADDAPLTFRELHVQRLQHYLAFHPETAGPYHLYLANPQAPQPQYDLAHYADRWRTQGVAHATLGPVIPNPLFAVATKVTPWSERYAWLIWITLLAAAAGVGVLVWRQARRAPPVQ